MPRIRTMPALLTLLALAATSASRATRAEDCLAGPNAQSPQGSHWYYRLDRATHRKCWYLGAQRAQRASQRRAAARGDSTPAADNEATPAAQTGIVAAPDPGLRSADPPSLAARATAGWESAEARSAKAEAQSAKAEAQSAKAEAAPAVAAPALPAPTASPPPEQIAPRTVATTTERVRPPAPAKPPETAQPAAAAAPAPANEGRGALPAALFGVALLLASVGTMLVRARRRMIRVHEARRPRRTLSEILTQAERGEPDRADAATSFFDRLRRGLDEDGVRTQADDELLLAPPRAANRPDIAAATLQPAIEQMPPEIPGSKSPGIAPAPDVERSLRQLLAAWERRAA